MKRAELLRLAQIGAAARLQALQREIAAIQAMFPQLRGGRSTTTNPYTAGVRRAVAGVRDAAEGAVARRRRKMPAEARRRIAVAQRKRWAQWRAAQNKSKQTKSPVAKERPAGSARKRT